MIRVRISNFIKRNKDKISDLGIKLIIVAIVVFIATIMLSSNRSMQSENDTNNQEVYKPTETVIKGADISKEQYKIDMNIIDQFLEYCNNKEVEKAYELISNECKNNLYPTTDSFKANYYDYIFKEKREYNLQSWVSTNEYTVYKIRYTTNMLATGIYEENNVYQDYITLLKNTDTGKISLGTFIISEEINKQTNTKEIQAKAIKKSIYTEWEKYELYIKNNTANVIKLDSLKDTDNIKIIGNSGGAYSANINKIFPSDIIINPEETKRLVIEFRKTCGSNNDSKYIQFSKVIRNYNEYIKNEDNYTDMFDLKIQL